MLRRYYLHLEALPFKDRSRYRDRRRLRDPRGLRLAAGLPTAWLALPRDGFAPAGTPPFPEGVSSFQLQLEDFVAACRGQRKPLVDAEQGLASLRLLEKLYANRTALAEPWRGSAAQSMALPASIRTPPSLKVGIFGASGFVGATLLERLRHRG